MKVGIYADQVPRIVGRHVTYQINSYSTKADQAPRLSKKMGQAKYDTLLQSHVDRLFTLGDKVLNAV